MSCRAFGKHLGWTDSACGNSSAPGCADLPAKRLGVKEVGEATLQVLRQRLQRHLEQATGLGVIRGARYEESSLIKAKTRPYQGKLLVNHLSFVSFDVMKKLSDLLAIVFTE